MGRLSDTHPELVKQWHPEKNLPLTPEDVSFGSRRKVWWVCTKNPQHVFLSKVQDRSSNKGCPVCSNRVVIPGVNDFATTHPELFKQWHPTFNTVGPETLHAGMNKKFWWVCEKGHSWEATLVNRKAGTGCAECYQAKIQPKHPRVKKTSKPIPDHLLAEWDHDRNDGLNPADFSSGSAKRIWWVCANFHSWCVSVNKRVDYRTGCPYCSGMQVKPGFNDLATTHPEIASQWHPHLNGQLKPSSVSYGSKRKVWWLCGEGHDWKTFVQNRTVKNNDCPSCNSSRSELQIAEYLKNLDDFVVMQNRREIIPPLELDLYIPAKKFAVEFNGLYWHSEVTGKNASYHEKKWQLCKDNGIQLIQIWEDDWNRNPELVKRMLAHKLGVSLERKVFARKARVEKLSKNEAEVFLEKNHIQGYGNGSYYLGLRDIENGEVVAVLVLKKEAGTEGRTLNIIRYATSCNVVGGFTKLLTHAERLYKPESFITFADHTVSDGGLYENNGFVADKELPPDYMYVVKGERKHKFNYRLKRFRNDPALKYEEGLTERELAKLNNLPRIWDAGKTRYLKTFQKA